MHQFKPQFINYNKPQTPNQIQPQIQPNPNQIQPQIQPNPLIKCNPNT